MTRHGRFAVLGFLLGMAMIFGSVGSAAEGPEGAAMMDARGLSGVGAARPLASDLRPRLLGTEFFLWDASAESGQGWQNNVVQGEYVQAFELNGTVTRVIVCGVASVSQIAARVAGVVYDDDGPNGAPGTLLAMGEASLIPAPNTAVDCSDLTVPAVERSGRTFVGALWMPSQDQGFFVAADTSTSTPLQDVYGRGRTGSTPDPWNLVRDSSPQVRALGIGARVVSMNQAMADCFDSFTVVCLNEGRFRVELDWRKPNDSEGLGINSGLRTDDSDVLWFFNSSNLEMLIKVLNACSVNNRYWVFFAATTNVELSLTVIDTHTGKVKTYFNPLNRAAPPIQDIDAFAACP